MVLLGLIAFWRAGSSYALSGFPKLPTLTTCRAAHHLTVGEANRHYPVHLRGVVTYYEIPNDEPEPTLFVYDSSGSVYISLGSARAPGLAPGDLVEVEGVSSGGDYAPIVAKGRARVIGQAALPSTAPRVGAEDMLSGAKDGQWVEIEAVVHSVHRDGESDRSEVVDAGRDDLCAGSAGAGSRLRQS